MDQCAGHEFNDDVGATHFWTVVSCAPEDCTLSQSHFWYEKHAKTCLVAETVSPRVAPVASRHTPQEMESLQELQADKWVTPLKLNDAGRFLGGGYIYQVRFLTGLVFITWEMLPRTSFKCCPRANSGPWCV